MTDQFLSVGKDEDFICGREHCDTREFGRTWGKGTQNESRSVITKKSRESGCDNSLLLLLGSLMYISFSSACFGKVDSDILVSMQTLDCYHRGDCTHADPGLLFLEDSITSFDLASETLLVTWKIETKFAEEDEEEQWGKLLRRNEWVC